jgi:hypothetical protein
MVYMGPAYAALSIDLRSFQASCHTSKRTPVVDGLDAKSLPVSAWQCPGTALVKQRSGPNHHGWQMPPPAPERQGTLTAANPVMARPDMPCHDAHRLSKDTPLRPASCIRKHKWWNVCWEGDTLHLPCGRTVAARCGEGHHDLALLTSP